MTSKDLERIRREQEKFLPDTAYIQQANRVSDGRGGESVVWQTVATVPCRLAQNQGREKEQGGKTMPDGSYVITFPHGTNVLTSHRVQINGTQYEVINVLTRSESTAVRVIARQT